jgi:hypothetical protein
MGGSFGDTFDILHHARMSSITTVDYVEGGSFQISCFGDL